MKYSFKYIAGFIIAASVFFVKTSEASSSFGSSNCELYLTSNSNFLQDTTKLPYPLKQDDYFSSEYKSRTSFNLESPSNITITVDYDPKTRQYTIYEKVGKYNIKPPRVMSEDEYRSYQFENSMREFWRKKNAGQSANTGTGLLPHLTVGGETFDRVFGSNTIEIIPNGTADLTFGVTSVKTDNPVASVDMKRSTTFDFKSKIQMNVDGKIGDKLKMNVQYNTEATFDFENNVKVEYRGYEDEIIQKIEAGNVTLPLPGTLITGSQSLFGFKTELKFGHLNVTTVFSKQNGQTQVIEVKGGAQTKDFSVTADKYDANKHFFLSQYFRNNYNKNLENIQVPNSGIVITKIEVWITNRTQSYENARDVVGFIDLGEGGLDNEGKSNIYSSTVSENSGVYPRNEINTLNNLLISNDSTLRNLMDFNDELRENFSTYLGAHFKEGNGYERLLSAKKLNSNEYTLNPVLGYISLTSTLGNNEKLAVAYEYTVVGQSGTFKVGEFSTDGIAAPKALFLKLIMGENHSPKIPPTWKLMMKNIYSLDAYQVSKDNFYLDVLYHDNIVGTDLKYIPGIRENTPLIRILNLDNVNSQGDAKPDGVFDFVEDSKTVIGTTIPITINAMLGKVIFPVLEPFGKDLASRIGNASIAENYVYQELYDSTLTKARLVSRKNKFKLEGTYQASSSNEISLNAANIPKGSVIVTAGGAKLEEDIDYSVDYNLGTVKIIKPGLVESGTPIKISLENNSLFNFQTKTLIGTHLDYKFSDRFNIGATILNLTERPLTQKVNYGNEAISNTIWGLNTSFQTEAPFLTRIVDFLPFIQTKEKSTLTFDAEFAQLIPGYSKAIGKSGTVFIDDFESSTTPIDMLTPSGWKLASNPSGQNLIFPEASYRTLRNGYNRAQFAWYAIDPIFLKQDGTNPSYIRNSDKLRSSHWVRIIYENEIFPNKSTPQGQPTNMSVLNLAFYPNERGPYNYTVTGLDNNGILNKNNPENSWGGIMRAISNTDFEANNIQYIEFWLMDPFVYDTTLDAGSLYFNLGNLSEDVLPDNYNSFEGGLPTTSELKNTDSTVWGRVPRVQSIPNAFSTDNSKRKYQDVGYDGLSSTYSLTGNALSDEETFFTKNNYLIDIEAKITDAEVTAEIKNDPSNDNYRYFLDPYYTTIEAGILDRYKRYNCMEGNTPVTTSSQSNSAAATSIPDNENLDSDPLPNSTENYYQYRVILKHDQMYVGNNFITNKVVYYAKMPAYSEKQKVTWYQFKIPIDKPSSVIGDPALTNITMARMVIRGANDTVILRFAKLQLVRDEWRNYDASLIEGQEGVPNSDLANGTMSLSTVNIEDNSSRTPINYVLPPGLSRTTDPSQSQTVEQNEQSMEIKITDLAEGDARSAYKSATFDIRKYRKLKMNVHAEAIPGYPLKDDDITLFLRVGTDNTDNYYEYELPLKVTPEGRYNNNKESDRKIVWPDENFFSIDLESFTNAKLARNAAMNKSGSSVNLSTIFTQTDGNGTVKVKGNPTLSDLKTLMIGVRNPSKSSDPNSDGLTKSVIVWVNELRVSNTTNEAGWAANARLSAKLADLGMITIAGSTSKPGFGSIESKVSDRTSEDYYQYDLSATMEMGRFFPVSSGIKIPVYVGYSESFANPEYNPLDPDIPLRVSLRNATKSERDSIKKMAQDYTRRKSINFTNVKIDRAKAKSWPLALSNFSVSYSYSEQYSRNIKTDHRINREIMGALTYNYNTNSKPIVPFKKVQFLNSKYLRLIKDINFNPIPSQFSFRTNITRNYFEQQLRNIEHPDNPFVPTYSKDFIWNRVYSLNWDLTQALKFDFNANNVARIDEPDGIVDRKNRQSYEHWRDSVLHNILNFGRNTEYNHQFNFTYNVPINKIPLLDWTSASARYSGNYRWTAGPILSDTSKYDPGNTIQNSNSIQLIGQVSMTTLYNKSGYLKRLNQKFDQLARGTPLKKTMKTVKYEEKGIKLKANVSKSINHKLKCDEVTVKVYTEKGAEIKVKQEVKSNERLTIKSDKEYENLRVVVEGKVPEKNNPLIIITETSLRILMGIKSISIGYTINNGTSLPGYKPTTKYLGMNDVNGVTAPGFAFVSGWQDPNFAWKAIQNGWLTKDTTLNKPFLLTYSENLNLRTTFEPFPSLKIELNAQRMYSRNNNEYYHCNEYGNYSVDNPLTTGNYSITIISLGNAFKSPNKSFQRFRDSRLAVAQRLYDIRYNQTSDPDYEWGGNRFPDGYSSSSQEVLIPAFLSAYSSYSPSNVPLENFPKFPFPNWQITYDGLAKLAFFKSFLRTFTLTHSYRSVYTIGAYSSNTSYKEENDGLSYVTNTIGDFISKRDIANVSINESFSPLIGFDMGFVNSLVGRFEIKNGRSLAMSFSNNQLTEVDSWEYVIGSGYRFENLPLVFSPEEGKQRTLKSDLRLRIDFSLRKSSTVLHKMEENIDLVQTGSIATSIKASADYMISSQVTVRAFFDWVKNTPLVTTSSYPSVNTSFGFSFKFTMVQ